MSPTVRARPTLYKGIQMRSRLEADYAAVLDRDGIAWKYEPDCYAGPDGQWLPDFRAWQPAAEHIAHLVELKPAYLLDFQAGEDQRAVIERIDEILRRMTTAWLSEPGATLQLVFWTYAEPSPDLVIAAACGSAWQVQVRGILFNLLWPGMGQMASVNRILSLEVS